MILETKSIGVGLLAPFLGAWTALAAIAGAVPCDTPLVLVDTDDQGLHGRVCEVAASAFLLLERCHLELTRPVTISFANSLGLPDQACIGLYHHGKEQIELLEPEAFEKVQEESAFWTAIPVPEHYDSIVVHELAHAHVGQAYPEGPACNADWEYVAYAMQLASLSASTRDAFIASTGVSPPITVEELNPMVLGFSPSSFAARSWLHFSEKGNGCDFVGKIVRGQLSLWIDPE